MHHEEVVSKELEEVCAKMFKVVELGSTGRFPGGKLTANDEGEIVFAVGVLRGKVVVNFGKPIASVGMSAKQARRLAKTLNRKANEARSGGEVYHS